ncbi:hypothetical protein F4703DRAFT_1917608 [Phycomyces blakesleeanus]
MVDIIDKVKSQYAIWKLEKYTKRRSFMPEYDPKDKEYYNQYYKDGTYHDPANAPPLTKAQTAAKRSSSLRAIHRAPSLLSQRATTLFRKTSAASTPPRCSENYNQSAHR